MVPRHSLDACRLAVLLLVVAAASTEAAAAPSNCTVLFPDAAIVRAAFLRVGNFPLPLPGRRGCRPVRRLRFPSRNLTGAVDWAALSNLSSLLTVDLSGNALAGGVDRAFWRAPSLRAVDVSGNCLNGTLRFAFDHNQSSSGRRLASLNASGNRFTAVEGVAALAGGLEVLDVSQNAIRAAPEGLRTLTRVRQLDLSGNMMRGRFPDDLPPLASLVSLNISNNNFSGVVRAEDVRRFGRAAFLNAGDPAALVIEEDFAPAPEPAPAQQSSRGGKKPRRRAVLIAVIATTCAAVVTALALALLARCAACCGLMKRHRKRKARRRRKKKDGKEAAVWEDDEVVVGAVKVAADAPVVLLERPLMELTLADLAATTSGFGRESQLAETGGRSGSAYRAVLPGDLHVVVRVVEGDVAGVAGECDDDAAAAAGLRDLGRLRHPNILPLLGYCIAGNQKLLLFEYMEKGDLHRWLHELPPGSIDTEDMSVDVLDATVAEDSSRRSPGDWPTRYRIILGIARGLAFLHQGWAGSSGRPIVHGHLVPTNVLLDDDMEPRISDFMMVPRRRGSGSSHEATPESDVYRFGTLVFELVTGQAMWDDASTSWARGVVRNRKGINIVDARLRDEATPEAEREMTECLQVGFLCTASSPEKRPNMQQVVGLLKDVRPPPVTAAVVVS